MAAQKYRIERTGRWSILAWCVKKRTLFLFWEVAYTSDSFKDCERFIENSVSLFAYDKTGKKL